MIHWLIDQATSHGYVVVFLGVGLESMGIPVPGETTLLIGVVLAATGHFAVLGVAAVGWTGAVLGDNLGYLIGRRWGHRLTHAPVLRRLYSPERMGAAETFFERRGWLAVFFGRFVAVLRIFAGPLAGMHHMPWPHFVIANAAGAACWVTLVTVVGVVIGNNLDAGLYVVSRVGYGGLAVVVIAGVIFGWAHWRRRSTAP